MVFTSFEDLLEHGRKQLLDFRENPDSDNSTGIEDSLVEPYLSQMIEMNNYIYTTASTNYPAALPFFQPFFLEGVTRLSTAKRLYQKLSDKYYWVLAQDLLTGDFPIVAPHELYSWDIAQSKDVTQADSQYLISDFFFAENEPYILGAEVLQYTDESVFKGEDRVVGIIIEDSCNCRKDLYRDINAALR